ncbi:MAG: cyanophycinase [Holophagaceae bacterium]|nr:cyanophycinase [Holophagaceae bacterium]
MRRFAAFLCWLWLLIGAAGPASAGAKLPYSYFRVGSAVDVTRTGLQGGTVLMGGGTDVDAAFVWMSNRGVNGDFLVIRATGTDAYNPYIKGLCPGVNSVATLIIPTITAANDARVATIIRNAEAIWIAGGDQSNYLNYWKGTAVQGALQEQINKGVPIGGTSAGMNVLTQFIYAAQASQGVTSSQALADPFNRYMSFDRNFVTAPHLGGMISDPHFVTRDRMGRDLAFLGRLYLLGWSTLNPPRGVSIDEQTALLIDETGKGTVVGSGLVYFLQAPGAPQVCSSKKPLTYRNIAVYRIGPGDTFNLDAWTGVGGDSYTVSAVAGVLESTQDNGNIY